MTPNQLKFIGLVLAVFLGVTGAWFLTNFFERMQLGKMVKKQQELSAMPPINQN